MQERLTAEPDHPYRNRPAHTFWRTAVAEQSPKALVSWTPKFALTARQRFATAGSCFAQHIGRELRERGGLWVEAEPSFPLLFPLTVPDAVMGRYGYGLFSFRTGNIYTAKLLAQWIAWADAPATPAVGIEADGNGRFIDLMRPAIQPDGFASFDAAMDARSFSLARIRAALATIDVFVFTLGLTEAWFDKASGAVFPVCPGTAGGRFRKNAHVFRNLRYLEIRDDLWAALTLMRRYRKMKVLLTVSPVPLTATATDQDVLSASVYSKSTLRAVAGDLAADTSWIDYFPSYEMIASHPARGKFFEANMRSVSARGVQTVMTKFFGALQDTKASEVRAKASRRKRSVEGLLSLRDEVCEEALLDAETARAKAAAKAEAGARPKANAGAAST